MVVDETLAQVADKTQETRKPLGVDEIHIGMKGSVLSYCGFRKRKPAPNGDPTCVVCIDMHRSRCKRLGVSPKW